MPCRIGMTSDLAERINYWRRQCNGRFSWQKLAEGLTYDEAQQRERLEAQRCGTHCKQEPGGERKSGRVYSVYRADCN